MITGILVMFVLQSVLCFTGFSDFQYGSRVGFYIPPGYSVSSACSDNRGGTAVACTLTSESGRSSGVVFLVGASVDTVYIENRRMHGLVSICPAAGEGFVVSGSADPGFENTSVAGIRTDGSAEWVAVLEGGRFRVCCGAADGGAVAASDHRMVFIDGSGGLSWSRPLEEGVRVNAAWADSACIVIAGEMPGQENTRPFAACYSLDGEMLWSNGYEMGGYGEFLGVTAVPGGFLFAGSHWDCVSPRTGLLLRTDLSGTEEARGTAEVPEGCQKVCFTSVCLLSEHEFAGLGFASRSGTPDGAADAFAAVFDQSLSLKDSFCLGDGGENRLEFIGAALDSSGEVRMQGLDRNGDAGVFCFSM